MTGRISVAVSIVVAALALGGLGLAVAQVGGDSPDEGEVEVQRRADLGGPEQLAEAERIQTRGSQISRRVATMLDESRRERDIIRVTCLNDKLTQVNANVRTLELRVDALREAVQGDNVERRNHEYIVITVLGQKFEILEQEANQCIGQDIFETGATRVETVVDPSTPDEDPNVMVEPPTVPAPFIPPPSSPAI